MVKAKKTKDNDDLQCVQCGYVEERTALPGQTLQSSPNWVCDRCSDIRNLNAYKAELSEAASNDRKAFLKVKIQEIEAILAENEE